MLEVILDTLETAVNTAFEIGQKVKHSLTSSSRRNLTSMKNTIFKKKLEMRRREGKDELISY